LCTEGSAQFTIDTQRHDVQKNDIIIISDRHVIDNYAASSDAAGLAMMLSVNFFYEVVNDVRDVSLLFLFSRNHPVVSLNENEVQTFKEYFFFLKKKIAETNNHYRRDLVRTLVLTMFYDLSNVIYRVQQIENKRQTRADAIFTQFIKLVEDNYRHERRVSWYAEQMCITPKYLSETVKAVSKNTPNEWIDKYVTLEARVLLKTSTLTIKEIADELHFANQSFLGKFFKEHVGVSPSEYRRK
ncbi:MAG: helix-turn-helix domain-containing protein, partial [Prevotellaceae bacterium]|nr:helix-turn-helix domain-containing protein [Prevotellaceae bacterium]